MPSPSSGVLAGCGSDVVVCCTVVLGSVSTTGPGTSVDVVDGGGSVVVVVERRTVVVVESASVVVVVSSVVGVGSSVNSVV
ncbi:MAG TPA: hypothetical protein VEA78_03890, partial [Acidimicrobiales bacterium]|nr:hypothetical protein [Acidimicrobiales bacterium]